MWTPEAAAGFLGDVVVIMFLGYVSFRLFRRMFGDDE